MAGILVSFDMGCVDDFSAIGGIVFEEDLTAATLSDEMGSGVEAGVEGEGHFLKMELGS